MMGDIQREKSKDPIISEPAYIHATNGTIACPHNPVRMAWSACSMSPLWHVWGWCKYLRSTGPVQRWSRRNGCCTCPRRPELWKRNGRSGRNGTELVVPWQHPLPRMLRPRSIEFAKSDGLEGCPSDALRCSWMISIELSDFVRSWYILFRNPSVLLIAISIPFDQEVESI
jgi:hypothetical protein